jgi:hypothetical protein
MDKVLLYLDCMNNLALLVLGYMNIVVETVVVYCMGILVVVVGYKDILALVLDIFH